MARLFNNPFLLSIVLPTIYWLWTKIQAWSTRNKAGCSSPVKYKHFDRILGFDLLAKKMKYTKAGKPLALDAELFAKYGKTSHTLFFGRNHWMAMDPLLIQTVAATQADKLGSAPSNRDGAFTTDGHTWKRSRELLQPVFSRLQVAQLSGLESHLQRFLGRIPRDDSTIDIQPLTQGLFLDSPMEFIFGKSSGSLSPSEQTRRTTEARQFSEDFDEGLRGMRNNYMTDKISWLVGPDKKWLAQCAKIHATLEGYIDEEISFQKQSKLPGTSSKHMNGSSGYQHVLLKELVKKYPDDRMVRLKHSWKSIPFSGGRRTCPAQQNAYTDMAYFLVRMVQEFKTIYNRDDCLEYVEEYVMTKSSRNGVNVAFSVK
ncbi:hypothetical protein BGAL_0181g00030 [Botrytis galanthina]|uniref:Uncharacterized protein n=1 Tax=Botrytis galanthina TaxID=278940 RepID=A0A4S8QXL0_9HELO|nr:hypothetical protein BGAL_0181g00030 [Botrytis galanthina]